MRFLCKILLLWVLVGCATSPALARERSGRGSGTDSGQRIEIRPYIEAAQVLSSELSPGNDTVTYSRIAVGVDTSINGRNTAGELSLRYARNIGWGRNARDGDEITGIARVSAAIIPRTLTIEAGGFATRTHFEGNGGSVLNPYSGGSSNELYSVYAGPSLQTNVGDAALLANYRIGYTRLDGPDGILTGSNGNPVDVFDHSIVQVATIHAGTKPGDVLPVGLGLGAGWYREDISNLDQRAEDKHIRADVTVPISRTVALVGGVGYEDVEISSRDALFDTNGNPVVDSHGRYVTDKSQRRVMAYDVDGLIWDVGVIWRPSVRTTLEAHVGRRYGATSYYGTFGWQMTRRSSVNVAVYDNIAGFGGQLNNALSSLPTNFVPIRNALTGDLNTCVGSLEGGSCIGNALGSIRSATFRGRGIAASYSVDLGRIQAGIGAGYDRRKFIAAEGTILASANGLIDENIWLAAYTNIRMDRRSTVSADIQANWLNSDFDPNGNVMAWGAGVAYDRLLTDRLSATAALRLDGITRELSEDSSYLTALLGMRYSF
jgi:hypothetical protein